MSCRTWFRLVAQCCLFIPLFFLLVSCKESPQGANQPQGTSNGDDETGPSDSKPFNGVINSIGMKLVQIPKGKFMMGSTKAERDKVLHSLSNKDDRESFEEESA